MLPDELTTRFEAVRVLGEGAHGRVVLARDLELRRPVAIKLLHPSVVMRPEARQRFEREAQVAARVTSPFVATLFDHGEAGGVPYLVTRYVEGQDLAEHLAEAGGKVTPRRALELLRDLLDGLEALHQADAIHRDLKPANVLLDTQGRAVITDLGLGRREVDETVTRTGVLLGTPRYMSPEQLDGLRADGRTDLYAAALIFCEAATGEVPGLGATLPDTAYRREWGFEDEDLLEGAALPPALGPVMLRALSPDPDERFPDAAALRAAVEEALGSSDLLDSLSRPKGLGAPGPGEEVATEPRGAAAPPALGAAPAGGRPSAPHPAAGGERRDPAGTPRRASAGAPPPAAGSGPSPEADAARGRRRLPWRVLLGAAAGGLALLTAAVLWQLASRASPGGAGTATGPRDQARLAALRAKVDADPVIAAALGWTDGADEAGWRRWHEAGEAFARLCEAADSAQLAADLPVRPPSPRALTDLARLVLVERCLVRSFRPGAAPRLDPRRTGLQARYDSWVPVREVRELTGFREDGAPDDLAGELRPLSREGRTWKVLRAESDFYIQGPEGPLRSKGVRMQNLFGARHAEFHAGDKFGKAVGRLWKKYDLTRLESLPAQVRLPLQAPDGRDLVLALILTAPTYADHLVLDLEAPGEAAQVVASSPRRMPPSRDGRSAFLQGLILRVPAEGLPPGITEARLTIRNIQPVARPESTVDVGRVYQLVDGPPWPDLEAGAR